MALVGTVDRLGLGTPSNQVAALFGFDDVIVIVPLGMAVKPGFRASKKSQAALHEVAAATDLTPEAVQAKWSDCVTIRLADVQRAELRKSLQGGLFGTIGLMINDTEGRTQDLLAHRSARESLVDLLTSLLGDRFLSGT